MAKTNTYIYPRVAPNVSSRADGLGSAFNTGAEFETDTIDYIKFTEFEECILPLNDTIVKQ